MGQHDNIRHAVLVIAANQGRFALTAAAIRRIVYAATDRGGAIGWNGGFRRQIGVLWRVDPDGPAIKGRETYILTDEGRGRLNEALVGAHDLVNYHADAWLPDAHRFAIPLPAQWTR